MDADEDFLSSILTVDSPSKPIAGEGLGIAELLDVKVSSHSHPRKYKQKHPGTPFKSVILHGLSYQTTLENLQQALKRSGAIYERATIVFEKSFAVDTPPRSKGYGFVNFKTLELAEKWVNSMTTLMPREVWTSNFVCDDFFVTIEYVHREMEEKEDWICGQCTLSNFSKRLNCFRCSFPKDQVVIKNEGNDDISEVPFHVLLLQGLSRHTSEDTIFQHAKLLSKPLAVWLVKDRVSRQSQGFAFLVFDCIKDAKVLLNRKNPLYIENAFISTSFAKFSSFIPAGSVTPFATVTMDNETEIGGPREFLTYWDQLLFCRPYPEAMVEKEIPPLPLSEEEEMKILAAKTAGGVTKKEKKQKVTKLSQQLTRWNELSKEISGMEREETEEGLVKGKEMVSEALIWSHVPTVQALTSDYTDLARIACILPGCRRKFEDLDALSVHLNQSPFHQQNMRIHRRSLFHDLKTQIERQGKGILKNKGTATLVKVLGETAAKEALPTTIHGLTVENKGNQMLRSMGWTSGEGLGSLGHQGIVKPIEAQIRNSKHGIGIPISSGSSGRKPYSKKKKRR